MWEEVLERSGIDGKAIQDLQYLVRGGALSWAGGCRILAHFWKDSDHEFENPSKWLCAAVRESREALQNHQEWDFYGNGEPPRSGRPSDRARNPWIEYDLWKKIQARENLEEPASSSTGGASSSQDIGGKGKGKAGRGSWASRG